MALEVTSDLRFELSKLNYICYHASMACKGFLEMIETTGQLSSIDECCTLVKSWHWQWQSGKRRGAAASARLDSLCCDTLPLIFVVFISDKQGRDSATVPKKEEKFFRTVISKHKMRPNARCRPERRHYPLLFFPLEKLLRLKAIRNFEPPLLIFKLGRKGSRNSV